MVVLRIERWLRPIREVGLDGGLLVCIEIIVGINFCTVPHHFLTSNLSPSSLANLARGCCCQS